MRVWLGKAMAALLAFGLLCGAAHAAPMPDPCEGPACNAQQVCPLALPAADEPAQTPYSFVGPAADNWHARFSPPGAGATLRPAPLALPGPPAYLRFHRFLL